MRGDSLRMTGWGLIALLAALAATGATAQDQSGGTKAPSAADAQLLDEIPNLPANLGEAWSAGVPADVTEAESSTAHYGLLLNANLQPTTLSECIALAVKNNTSLQVQRLNPIAAAAGVRKAYSVFDPAFVSSVGRNRLTTPATTSLSGGGAGSVYTQDLNFNAGLQKTMISGGQLSLLWTNNRRLANASLITPITPLYTTGLGLNFTQPLLQNFGWRYALLMVDVAQSTAQSAYFNYVANLTNIVARVERGYWLLVLASENVSVQEHGLSLSKELLRQNEGKFKVGSLPQTAVLEAQVDVANREALLIQARNSLDVTRDSLRAVVNAPDDTSTSTLIMIDPSDKPRVEPYRIDLQQSLQLALGQRPELVAARYDVEAKGLQRKIAQNQLMPQLNLVAGMGVNGMAGTLQNDIVFPDLSNPRNPAQPVGNQAIIGRYGDALALLPDGRYYSYTVGAMLQVPLDNAQAKANYAQSNINLSQSKLSLQQLQESITLEIKNSVSNLQSDLKSIEATRIARTLAEQNVRNQKARYDVGLATTKDLLDYSDRLTRAQFAEVQALTAYNSDLAELRRVEGTLLTARNVIVEAARREEAAWWARF